jgi:carboxymethylenebutenolidase
MMTKEGKCKKKRTKEEMLEDFIAAYEFLKVHPNCNGHIGVVGFCFGGWIANMMAVKIPTLGAAVPYYGGQPTAEEAEKIRTPLLLNYAGLDTRVNEGWPAYETILKKNKVPYTVYFYEGVNHGFHNNTTPRYDEKQATLSWNRSIAFFKENLKKR